MRLLQRVVETPHPCTYLPAQRASLDVRLMLDVTPLELDALLSRGWRRFGPCYFRPQCAACDACVTTRVIASQFAPTRSQRRAVRLAAGLRRVVGVPTVDDARLRLYSRWLGEPLTARRLVLAALAALAEPFSFQLLRHTGAAWGWLAFLSGRVQWGHAPAPVAAAKPR